MNKKVVGIAAAALMAIIGTVVIVFFVQGAEDRALSRRGPRHRPDGRGSGSPPARRRVRSKELVKEEKIPVKIAPEGVISDLVQVNGLVTNTDIFAGETLLAGRFIDPEQFSARKGSVKVPEGLLEVTVAMSQEQFIGGVPVPGDQVARHRQRRAVRLHPVDERPAAAGGERSQQHQPQRAQNAADLRYTKIILQQALVTNVQGNALPEQPNVQSATDRVAPAVGLAAGDAGPRRSRRRAPHVRA